MYAESNFIVREIIKRTAAQLAAEPPSQRSYWREADFELALVEAARVRPEVADVQANFTVPVTGWWPGHGRVDLVVEPAVTQASLVPRQPPQFDLLELKWCNDNKFEEAMWDAVKLLCAHSIDRVRSTYLVYAAKPELWSRNPVGAEFFLPSYMGVEAILESHIDRWQRVLAGGTGRPRVCPSHFQIESRASVKTSDGTSDFEIRAVQIQPYGDETFDPTALAEASQS